MYGEREREGGIKEGEVGRYRMRGKQREYVRERE
jgi:hypothetical protein